VPSSCLSEETAVAGDRAAPRAGGVGVRRVSGTNAHVILEQGHQRNCEQPQVNVPRRCRGSSRPDTAGAAGAGRTGSQRTPGPLCPQWTSVHTRHRSGGPRPPRRACSPPARACAKAARDSVQDNRGKTAFLFSGPGLAADRHGTRAVPAGSVCSPRHSTRCWRIWMCSSTSRSATSCGATSAGLLEQTRYTQPRLFAVEARCSACWRRGAYGRTASRAFDRRDHRGPCRRRAVPRGRCTLGGGPCRLMDSCRPGGAMVSIQGD